MIDAERACREFAPMVWPTAEIDHTGKQAEGFEYFVVVTVEDPRTTHRYDAAYVSEKTSGEAWSCMLDELRHHAAGVAAGLDAAAARQEEAAAERAAAARATREHAQRIRGWLAITPKPPATQHSNDGDSK